MDMTAVKEEIKLELTGDITDLELSDAVLTKLVNKSLRELQRYYANTELLTLPYTKCIDLSSYHINAVAKVHRATGYASVESSTTSNAIDPMYASQWQLLSGLGNVNKLMDYAYNYSAWNTLLQVRNTTSTDLAFRFDKASKLLYINIASNYPDKITIEYIPQLKDVSQLTSEYWIDNLIKLACANAKVVVGRIRSKYKQPNALWTLDGDTLLAEGLAELSALREYLQEATQLCYPID